MESFARTLLSLRFVRPHNLRCDLGTSSPCSFNAYEARKQPADHIVTSTRRANNSLLVVVCLSGVWQPRCYLVTHMQYSQRRIEDNEGVFEKDPLLIHRKTLMKYGSNCARNCFCRMKTRCQILIILHSWRVYGIPSNEHMGSASTLKSAHAYLKVLVGNEIPVLKPWLQHLALMLFLSPP